MKILICIPGLLLLSCPLAAQSLPPSEELKNRAYIDDDDQRPLADLSFRVDPDARQNLRIGISAVGPDVEPIGGYRGIHGANRYTAEELALLLNGTHSVQVITKYEAGPTVNGEVIEGRYGTLPQRRLLIDGRMDYLGRTAWEYPLEIVINPNTATSGLRNTFVYVNGQARLRCRYRIVDGQLQDLEVQSLGHDGFIAASDRRAPAAAKVLFASTDETKPLPLPTDWADRDIEGKWAWYAKDVLLHPENHIKWPVTLRNAGELELLEMLALYTPDAFKSHGVIEQLYDAEAPQWIRVAAWHSNGPPNFGHGLQQSTRYMTHIAPGLTEDWIDRYREEIDNYETSLQAALEQLRQDKFQPVDSTSYLPPLKPDEVFAYLKLDQEVVDLGERLTAKPGVVYRQQVLRAISGVPISGRRDQPLLNRLRLMTKHTDRVVRQAAFLAHTYTLPNAAGTQSFDDFLETVASEEEHDTVRQAALMAYSYHRHPSVLLTLHDVAANPEHPCWEPAVSRLGDLGFDVSIALLESVMDPKLSQNQQKILKDSLSRLTARRKKQKQISAWQMTQRIRAAVFARATSHPLAATMEDWVEQGSGMLNSEEWTSLQRTQWNGYGDIWLPGTAEEFAADFNRLRKSIPQPGANAEPRLIDQPLEPIEK